MIELDVIHSAPEDSNPKALTPMQQINDAFKACQFGRFHIKLICATLVGTIAGIQVTASTSYLLPEAECDMNMDLLDKGLLNTAPFIGMTMSSVLAGFLTDTFGRKRFLILSYGGIFFFSIVAGSSQNYRVLLSAKFLEGLSFAIPAHGTYLSEFCHSGIRDRVLIFRASFIAVTQIISPLMAWGILTQNWKYSLCDGYFVLNTWNFYLYIMSLWSFFACVFYAMLPESPKYLVTQQKYEEAREILAKMYKENTGRPAETYPYIDIWRNVEKEKSDVKSKTTIQQIVVSLHNVKPLFRKALLWKVVVFGGVAFTTLAIYNILRQWFPQLSTIIEHNQTEGNQDMCVILDSYTSDLKSRGNSGNSTSICIPTHIGPQTYINSIIIGFVCLFLYFITGALVNLLGKRIIMLVFGAMSVGITLGLRWASSRTAVVALFAVDTAISQLMKELNITAVIQMFPTEVRTLALSLVVTFGRLGTLSGNIGFSVLLDIGCVVPIFTMSAMLMCVTVLTLFMPK